MFENVQNNIHNLTEFAAIIAEKINDYDFISLKYQNYFSLPLTDNELLMVLLAGRKNGFACIFTDNREQANEFMRTGKY